MQRNARSQSADNAKANSFANAQGNRCARTPVETPHSEICMVNVSPLARHSDLRYVKNAVLVSRVVNTRSAPNVSAEADQKRSNLHDRRSTATARD